MMNYKERMSLAIKEGMLISDIGIYEDCKDTCDVMERMSQALVHYMGDAAKFTKYGYVYEIHEEALSAVASLISDKIIRDFDLGENDVFESVADLYLNSSAADNEFKGEYYE